MSGETERAYMAHTGVRRVGDEYHVFVVEGEYEDEDGDLVDGREVLHSSHADIREAERVSLALFEERRAR
ncbi:MAG TPA: hypothetical protein VF041_23140 [Gemmatimonadaceae bacterium]